MVCGGDCLNFLNKKKVKEYAEKFGLKIKKIEKIKFIIELYIYLLFYNYIKPITIFYILKDGKPNKKSGGHES
ncbi:MAG: hypothetical protein A7316_09455 [Candidatus Altiarchaeales archaeon WOR_SM1_86-2]|nr:MAG: hypothetical protein A7316_09455 [Candidatus Altiarchaeales archaeon WOR_SM1_86-2]